MINHTLSLDMCKQLGRTPQRLVMRRGESETQHVEATITDGGEPYEPTLPRARLCLLHADNTWARCEAAVDGNIVSVTFSSEMLNAEGLCRTAYFEFLGDGKSETTEGFQLLIKKNVDGTTDPSESYDDALDKLYEKWSAYEAEAEDAESARVDAENSRVDAENGRVKAEAERSQGYEEDHASVVKAVADAKATVDATVKSANEQVSKAVEGAEFSVSQAVESANESVSKAVADAHEAASQARGSVGDPDVWLGVDEDGYLCAYQKE